MKKVLVKYKVKTEKAEENKQLIRQVFAELKESQPKGIRYAGYVQPDGVSFVHIASIETADGTNPLSLSAAFMSFQMDIRERCEELPEVIDLTEIGSYQI